MYFDWRTWGIWTIGFTILIIWIWIPVKEIRRLVHKKRSELSKQQDEERKSK
jgi:hypothetical protein